MHRMMTALLLGSVIAGSAGGIASASTVVHAPMVAAATPRATDVDFHAGYGPGHHAWRHEMWRRHVMHERWRHWHAYRHGPDGGRFGY